MPEADINPIQTLEKTKKIISFKNTLKIERPKAEALGRSDLCYFFQALRLSLP